MLNTKARLTHLRIREMARKYHYTEEEIAFIESNWQSKTDKEIAIAIGRSEESIARQRKKYGWVKNNGRPTNEDITQAKIEKAVRAVHNGGSFSVSGLDKDQRLELYKKNFASANKRYYLLLNELNDAELEYYKYKYVDFMDSVDTITPQEEDSLHHMIMTDINISRLRKRIRIEEEMSEDGSPMTFGLFDVLEKSEKRYLDYQKSLHVTREKRLSNEKEQKETIATVVQMYRNKMAREELGRQAGLMELFKSKAKEDMATHRYLLGGE